MTVAETLIHPLDRVLYINLDERVYMTATVPMSLADMIPATEVISAHPDYNPNIDDLNTARLITQTVIMGDCAVKIYIHADDSAFIYWTDFVANEWCEHYPSLTYAYARLALLQACGENAWEKMFTQSPQEFVAQFDKFLDSAVK